MILFGASGHCKVIVEILQKNGIEIKKIIDDKPKVNSIFGIIVEHTDGQDFNGDEVIISIGNNLFRKQIAEKYKLNYKIAIHPNSSVSQYSTIEEGTVVMANAVINPSASIGKHCIVNTAAIIEHDCVLEDFVHISPNAALAGNVTIGEGSHIGIGASIIQGINVGKWVTVGAGSVIIKDIPDYATVVGNPGKIIKFKEKI